MRFRNPVRALAFTALLLAQAFAADTKDAVAIRKLLADASDVGLPAGAVAPELKLKDQTGGARDFPSLTGPHGLVLVFFRSADW